MNKKNKTSVTASSLAEIKNQLGQTVPKPDRTVTVEQETIDGVSEQNKKLRGVGELLTPDGLEYVGSFAAHIYRRHQLDNTFNTEIYTQVCLDPHVIREEVSFAVYTSSISIAKRYGFELDKNQRKVIKGK